MYALHVLQEKYLNELELEKCTQFLKVHDKSRVLVIDLSQENLSVVKEVSQPNQHGDIEDYVITGVDTNIIINSSSHYAKLYKSSFQSHWDGLVKTESFKLYRTFSELDLEEMKRIRKLQLNRDMTG